MRKSAISNFNTTSPENESFKFQKTVKIQWNISLDCDNNLSEKYVHSSKYLTFQISLSQQSKIFATMYSFYFKISHKMQWKPLQLNYFIFGNNFFTAVSTFSYMTIMDCLAGSVVLSKTKKDGMKEEEKLPRHLQCHLS